MSVKCAIQLLDNFLGLKLTYLFFMFFKQSDKDHTLKFVCCVVEQAPKYEAKLK